MAEQIETGRIPIWLKLISQWGKQGDGTPEKN